MAATSDPQPGSLTPSAAIFSRAAPGEKLLDLLGRAEV
jgi:hypothetical protein